MSLFSQTQKREIIMQHYLSPEFKRKIDDEHKIKKYGQACADYLEFNFDVVDGTIQNLYFDAKGCAFMVASTDLFIKLVQGKKIENVLQIIEKYEFLLKNGHCDDLEILGELAIFDNVIQHPNRYYCATMLSSALKEKLNG